jgi:hypothetical protein
MEEVRERRGEDKAICGEKTKEWKWMWGGMRK